MVSQLCSALVALLVFTILTGILYPLAVTGIAQIVFPAQANGSLITRDNQVIGSALIGQNFTDAKYFWSRPSATSPVPYNAAASSGSNLGATNPALKNAVETRVNALRAADPGNTAPIPIDLVTSSASGLDPDISVASVLYQAPRVARVRGLDENAVRALIAEHTQARGLGFFGETRVNVLELNLALDNR